MAILVQCSCGKRMRVADEHAGRRVKCPACGEMQTVGAGDKGAAKKPAAASLECHAHRLLGSSRLMKTFLDDLETNEVVRIHHLSWEPYPDAYSTHKIKAYVKESIVLAVDNEVMFDGGQRTYCEIRIAKTPDLVIDPDDISLLWGKLPLVWRDGSWIVDGPWKAPIVKLLAALIPRLQEVNERAARKSAKEHLRISEEHAREQERLKRNWS